MKTEELNIVLQKHVQWLRNPRTGKRADLREADLRGAKLPGVDLRDAYLGGADLRGADLRGADLRGAFLWNVKLQVADLREVDLREAKLEGADLQEADLRGADLRDAKLWDCRGNLCHIKSLQLETYCVTYTSEVLQIGCQRHPIDDWWGFDDNRISCMSPNALGWWLKWKPILQQIIAMSPAEPTGYAGGDK